MCVCACLAACFSLTISSSVFVLLSNPVGPIQAESHESFLRNVLFICVCFCFKLPRVDEHSSFNCQEGSIMSRRNASVLKTKSFYNSCLSLSVKRFTVDALHNSFSQVWGPHN